MSRWAAGWVSHPPFAEQTSATHNTIIPMIPVQSYQSCQYNHQNGSMKTSFKGLVTKVGKEKYAIPFQVRELFKNTSAASDSGWQDAETLTSLIVSSGS